MDLNNFSGKDNIKKLQEILTERSKLQAVISHEENEKSQLQFRLIDLDKISKELIISITQKKFIVDEYDQLILKTESTLKKMSDDLQSLFYLLKTALSVELEPPKIYKIDMNKSNAIQNFAKQKGRNVSSIMADYENVMPCRRFKPANGL